jgi:hypothetical protein
MDLPTEHDISPEELEANKSRKRKRQENDIPDIRKFRRVRILASSGFTGLDQKKRRGPKRCHSCNIAKTPEWRRGPDGAGTLCNACGLCKYPFNHGILLTKRCRSLLQVNSRRGR